MYGRCYLGPVPEALLLDLALEFAIVLPDCVVDDTADPAWLARLLVECHVRDDPPCDQAGTVRGLHVFSFFIELVQGLLLHIKILNP